MYFMRHTPLSSVDVVTCLVGDIMQLVSWLLNNRVIAYAGWTGSEPRDAAHA